jgi:hypothetical protein
MRSVRTLGTLLLSLGLLVGRFSTQNLQLSTRTPADYLSFRAKADVTTILCRALAP